MIPKALILRAPGINRDEDAAAAIELAGGQADRIHVNRVVEGAARMADYGLLIIPGGFSYGDHLGAGRHGDDAIINNFYIDFIIRMSRINSYFGGGVINAAIDVLWCAWVRRRYNQYGPILVSARCKTAVDVYRGFGNCR